VRVAQSQRDMVFTQEEQNQNNFEQNIQKIVKQFNLQAGKVDIAAKTDRTAERRNEVARRLYILGQSTILDLNASVLEKDTAKRNYINALYNYWSLYYTLRSLTLYDFEKGIALTEDYDSLIK
jgi:outer membrane protein TolC